MDINTCKFNCPDADALLPPRKRLLAGLKRQNSDVNSSVPFISTCSAGNEIDGRFNTQRSQLNNLNLSSEEIVEAARIAAIEASKVAEAARAKAEEKAAKAAKAVATAKSALELVGTISGEITDKGKFLKNKMKKHVPVEALYNNSKENTNCRMDEELARKLHRVINSSPRILKNSSGSDSKNHKHKRLKSSSFSGGTSICSGVSHIERNVCLTTSNYDNGGVDKLGVEDPVKNTDKVAGEWEPSKTTVPKFGKSKMEGIMSLDKFSETLDSMGKKKGKLKQKKLPLSICSLRDQTSPREALKPQCMSKLQDNAVRTMEGNRSSLSTGPSCNSLIPNERASTWKCQSVKAPARAKQNKVMQS